MKNGIVLFFILILLGCNGSPPDYSSETVCEFHNYQVHIDSKFSPGENEKIFSYLGQWTSQIGNGLTYDISIQDIDPSVDAITCEIKVMKEYGPEADQGYVGWTIGREDSSGKLVHKRVWINPDLINDQFNEVVGHELGHVFGLGHTTDIKSIMNPRVPSISGCEITCQNKKDLCNIWGCDPGC